MQITNNKLSFNFFCNEISSLKTLSKVMFTFLHVRENLPPQAVSECGNALVMWSVYLQYLAVSQCYFHKSNSLILMSD